jgi:hypothetical protein
MQACFQTHALEMLAVGVPVAAVTALRGCERSSFALVAPPPAPRYSSPNASELPAFSAATAGGGVPSLALLLSIAALTAALAKA